MSSTTESLNALVNLLGEENAEKLKKNIVQLITEQVESDFRNYGEYLLYPPDMAALIKDVMEDTEKKIRKMYKDAVIEINQDYINKMKQYMSQQIDSSESSLRKEIIDYARNLRCQSNEYGKERQIGDKLLKICKATQKEI